jgi:hypothetical protein
MLIFSQVGRLVAACCGVLVLAACDAPATPAPASSTRSPATATSPYTASGTTLGVGQSAVVPWQDPEPGSPVGTLRLAVTEISEGEAAGLAFPDPGTPPSLNDETYFVHLSATNTGTAPVHPGGLPGLITVYDSKGEAMIPATTYDQNCRNALGADALPRGGQVATCKAYLGSVLAPHITKVVFGDFVGQDEMITWTW